LNEILEDLLPVGDARPLKHPAGPVLGPIDLTREDPHD
jgi:hypothetical protein